MVFSSIINLFRLIWMHWHRHIDTRGTPYTISSDLWLELVCWDGIHAPRMLVLRWKPGVVLIYTHRGVYPVGAMHKIPYLHLFTKSRTPMTCGMTYNQRKWLFTMVRNPTLGGAKIQRWGGAIVQHPFWHFWKPVFLKWRIAGDIWVGCKLLDL